MYIHERLRRKKNEKVKEFAQSILKECERKGFTVADMKDLAEILPNEIGKVVTLSEERTRFNSLGPATPVSEE